MLQPSFDEIYMRLASELAKRSHCVKKKVGAVLTKHTRVVATGYNGPASGSYHCDEHWPETGCPRSARGGCLMSLHAEQNAILYALRNQVDLQGSTLYTTLAPCLPCARLIFSAGITKILYQESYAAFKQLAEEEGLQFLQQLGIEVVRHDLPTS